MACIDKENLLKDLITIYAPMQEQKDILVKCIKKVNEQPTADVEEVKHGEWENVADYGNGNCIGYCSVCKTPHEEQSATHLRAAYRHCRWCGAKMDGGKE